MSSAGELVDIVGYDNAQYWTGDLVIPIDSASDGATVWVSSNHEGAVNAYEVAP